jgi:hypothetical protein
MKPVWTMLVRKEDALGLAALLGETAEVCENSAGVWIKGPSKGPESDPVLRMVPAVERWNMESDGQLTANGSRVPSAKLPAGPWAPLQAWLRLAPQSAALPGALGRPAEFRLQRGEPPASLAVDIAPAAILTNAKSWLQYADRAASVRLKSLAFAADHSQRVLIAGRPLPPLPGRRLYASENLYFPCGFHWRPALDAASLREVLRLSEGESALFEVDGSFERIEEARFIAASRSAIRLSLGGADD